MVMKHVHDFVMRVNQDLLKELVTLGVDVTEGLQVLRMKDSDSRLPKVLEITAKPEYKDLVKHYYSIIPNAMDLIRATALIVIPKVLVNCIPFDNLKYLEDCFDTSNACPPDPSNPDKRPLKECGLGFFQIKPLRMKTTKFENRKLQVFTLNEGGDRIFVRQELYDQVFRQLGMDFWPVIDYRTGKFTEKFVQLKITEEVELDTSELTPTVCNICKRTKYKPLMSWYAPRPLSTELPICKSVQKFGLGFRAESLIIVNSTLYRTLRDYGLSHNIFWPCADEGVRYPDI